VRSRSDETAPTRVDLREFAPVPAEFLGRAAYVQLTIFEALTRVMSTAPNTAAKAELSRIAELSLGKHRALVAEIEANGGDAGAAMEPFTKPADEFERVTRGEDWYESLLSCYLTAGFLDEFFSSLAAGLPADQGRRIAQVLDADSGERELAALIQQGIDDNPRLASRLAMWGRRLVGDTMLVARSALNLSQERARHDSEEARIEPVFTELIAAHTRRMDVLGLSA
jgi:tRNA-(MS[2]IO[6]A)-hydroxylase (MiaE)-like